MADQNSILQKVSNLLDVYNLVLGTHPGEKLLVNPKELSSLKDKLTNQSMDHAYLDQLEKDLDEDISLINLVNVKTASQDSLPARIKALADQLDSQDNELLATAEDHQLDSIAASLVSAATLLRKTADEIEMTEVPCSELTAEQLEEMAAVAAAFDESGDELLRKQANVLDELLLTLSAPPGYIFNFKKAETDKIDTLKKKYKEVKEQLDQEIGVKEALEAIEQSAVAKTYRPLESALSTRYCPDHSGAAMARVGDDTWQCSLDHKVYNYAEGFETLKGDKVPGGSVAEQTNRANPDNYQMFDTRDQRLGIYRE